MWQDLRYGLRSIGNQPGFTAFAVLTLAALAATYFPARRAMNVNPIVALRGD